MRIWRIASALGGIACLTGPLSACASKPDKVTVVESRAVEAGAPKTEDDPSITQTMRKSAADVGDGFGDAITAPLVDLNLKRKEIPSALIRASKNTYDLTNMERCESIAGEVALLDDALGPDFDEPPAPESSMQTRGGKMASDATLTAVRSAATDVLPMRGLIRKMTGAEKHQKVMDRAIAAGHVRRAYLKGVGMNKNCAPPAAPSWFVPKQARVTIEEVVDAPASPIQKVNKRK
ncbi:hypothetical protein [Asticcacaulis sp. AND118]|uniref:hypothetical protein n=1 Tax=Asticcacaulis sp. AND118 TaxID=2840468 RepID=UPI001CFFC67C|nr:hypothetical protein [Asticcacaulis sp. AND118]UDF02531.1 hypothetical protein LH365_08775 [Asticcacaulis sp. AND118]